MKERFKATPAAYLILERNGQVVLIKRRNTGYRDGEYTLPAGHVEENESPIEATTREVKEEVGVEMNIADLKFATVVYHFAENGNDRYYIDFFFVCQKWLGEPQNMEPEKCDEIGWFDINNLPENTMPNVKLAIEDYLNKETYSELR
jgi:8-oxo-dGTP diphosphatase